MSEDYTLGKIQTIIDDIESACEETFEDATQILFFNGETSSLKLPFASVYFKEFPLYYDQSDNSIGIKSLDIEFAIVYYYKWQTVKSEEITKPQDFIIPLIQSLTNTLFAKESINIGCMFRELTSIDLEYQDEPNTGYDAFLVSYKLTTEVSIYNV